MQNSEMLERMRSRLDAFSAGDRECVLEEQALSDARTLLHDVGTGGDENSRIEVTWMVAFFHWARFHVTPEDQRETEIGISVTLFGSIAKTIDERAIPEPIRWLLDRQNEALKHAEDAAEVLDRMNYSYDAGALDEIIQQLTHAISSTPIFHPDHAPCIALLGVAALTRFRHTGNPDELDRAVAYTKRAIAVAHPESNKLANMFSYLCVELLSRAELTGSTEDLDAAVDAGQQAIDHDAATDLHRAAALMNYGSALTLRSRRKGNPNDLNTAIALGQQALEIVPQDEPALAIMNNDFGMALRARFSETGDQDDLESAVLALRRAVALVPSGNTGLPMFTSNLGLLLLMQYQESGNRSQLDEAESAGRLAVTSTPADEPDLAFHQTRLGAILLMRSEGGSDEGTREAIDLWAQAARSNVASTGTRFLAAISAARVLADRDGPAAAADMYRVAVSLVPRLAWLGLSDSERRRRLHKDAESIARDGAACAIAARDPVLAATILEQGRAVIWSQLLDTRTDLAGLERSFPEIAQELYRCSAILEQSDDGASSIPGMSMNAPHLSGETRRMAARRFDQLVAHIRTLPPTPDFPEPDQFLAPPAISSLLPKAEDREVVIVNISSLRCDALVLSCMGVSVIELPSLTEAAVTQAADRYLIAMQIFEQSTYSAHDQTIHELAISQTLAWLWDNVARPILDGLGHTDKPSDSWPHICWCPTGTLTSLPLHAAGHHAEATGRTVFDRVISSYTSSARALAGVGKSAYPTRDLENDARAMVVIALPDTPGQSHLPGVSYEVDLLRRLFPDDTRVDLIGQSATRHSVTAALTSARLAHFSCHAFQDLLNPAETGFLPYDWQTQGLIGIKDLTRREQSVGEFAFLAACKTATGSVVNVDEAINIATAMQYMGWQHIIATLWSVEDNAAALIVANLYPTLFRGTAFDPGRAANELHNFVRQLRDATPNRPSTWAPFMHVGK